MQSLQRYTYKDWLTIGTSWSGMTVTLTVTNSKTHCTGLFQTTGLIPQKILIFRIYDKSSLKQVASGRRRPRRP